MQAVADEITKAVADVRGALDGGNAEDIRTKISDLQKATMKIGEAMAKEGQSQQQQQPPEQGSSDAGSQEKKD